VNKDPQETNPERPNQAAIDGLMLAEIVQKAERVGEANAGLGMPSLFCQLTWWLRPARVMASGLILPLPQRITAPSPYQASF